MEPFKNNIFELRLPKSLKVTPFHPKNKALQKAIAQTVTQHMERNIWVVTKAYGNNYYDIAKGSTLVMQFNHETGKLDYQNAAYNNTNPTRHIRVWNQTGTKLIVGTQCRISYRENNVTQKPEIIQVINMPFPQRTDVDPEVNPFSGNPGIWIQAAGSVQKAWLGYTELDFSILELPSLANWEVLFNTEGSDRFSYRDFIYPNLLAVEETYTDMPSTDPNKRLSTFVEFAHRINGENLESFLYLYSLAGRTDNPSSSRVQIDTLSNADLSGEVTFPLQAWTLPFPLSGIAKTVLPTISNGYARTYNNTLHLVLDESGNATEIFNDSYDRVHVTFIQPSMLQIDGLSFGTDTGGEATETESFVITLDGEPITLPLKHKVIDVTSITTDSGPFEDFYESYSITGDDNNLLYLDPLSIGDESGPISNTLTIEYTYEIPGTRITFQVFEVNLNRLSSQIMTQTSILPSIQVNAVYNSETEAWEWPGFMGSAHTSVAMNTMIQAHIAGEKIILSRRAKTIAGNLLNWMEWRAMEARTWDYFLPEMTSDTPQHKRAYQYFDHAPTMNNSPAKIKDANIYPRRPSDNSTGTMISAETEQPGDGFVLPYFSIWGERFNESDTNYGGDYRAILWLVYCAYSDSGVFSSSSVKLLERTNPTSILSLTSLDAAIADHIKHSLEYGFTFGVVISNTSTYGYACPKVVSCEYFPDLGRWGPNFQLGSCADPCWGPSQCDHNPEASGCFCYDWEPPTEIITGISYELHTWGGYLESGQSVTSVEGETIPPGFIPPLNKQGLINIITPLPLSRPNLSAPNFQKTQWTAHSDNSPTIFNKDAIDPQIAISPDDGAIYAVIIESKFVYVPSGTAYVNIHTGDSSSSSESFPEPGDRPEPGQILCGWEYECWDYSYIYTSCESCNKGPITESNPSGGYVKSGPYTCELYVRLPNTPTGDSFNEYTSYGRKEVRECRETKLVISNKTGTSVLTVPICASFTGVTFSNFRGDFTISEALPVAENCWQIGVWKGFVILLIDARDAFNYSPRPVIQIHDRFTGIKVAEYKTLIPDSVYNDRNAPGDPGDPNSEKTKWKMWGRQINEHCPGPRFKFAYQPDLDGATGDENKPLFIHVSADVYQDISETSTVEARREYRILRFDGTALTEARTISETKSNASMAPGDVDTNVVFPSTYPSPGALGSMAITQKEVFLPALSYAGEDFEMWKLLSHHIS